MPLKAIPENPAYWDAGKDRILGGVPEGVFTLPRFGPGDLVPGEWWRVEDEGRVVGYGWMDTNWGDAEILLAVDPQQRSHGVGTFILDRLEDAARARGLHYLYNVVPATHPDAAALTQWLEKRGFMRSSEDKRLLRRQVPRA